MTEDELLASAFRKLLASPEYRYIFIDDEHVSLDASWSVEEDGLTPDELRAPFYCLLPACSVLVPGLRLASLAWLRMKVAVTGFWY